MRLLTHVYALPVRVDDTVVIAALGWPQAEFGDAVQLDPPSACISLTRPAYSVFHVLAVDHARLDEIDASVLSLWVPAKADPRDTAEDFRQMLSRVYQAPLLKNPTITLYTLSEWPIEDLEFTEIK